MTRRVFPLAAVVLISISGMDLRAVEDPGPEGGSLPPAAVIESMNGFAFDLYGRVAGQSQDNLFVSPVSISTALTMTSAGAGGNTRTQMAAVLRLPEQHVHESFGAVVNYLNAKGRQENVDLTMANALWGQHDYQFRLEFTELLQARYGAGLRLVDFRRDTEGARRKINSWVEEQTGEKIQDLIPPGILTDYTRLVLTNAIYFHGHWRLPFDPKNTRPLPFTALAGKRLETPTMFQQARLRYAEDAATQCLEMNYTDSGIAMTILLPKQKDGLGELEKDLDAEVLQQWTDRLRAREVKVYLPKFALTAQFQLKSVLAEMGMPDAFDNDRCDFSGMDGTRDLFIHEVVHKAFVDVNEVGTEAAAATGVVVGVTSAPLSPPEFRADRPFMFLIRDTHSGAVLFLGRLMEPQP